MDKIKCLLCGKEAEMCHPADCRKEGDFVIINCNECGVYKYKNGETLGYWMIPRIDNSIYTKEIAKALKSRKNKKEPFEINQKTVFEILHKKS